ncbi:hypothetical protein L484_000416 [Morus notabilis]|uniref:Uncharacterized protein n=1 Tax=Morus notabilis TaxID=981085 RepID=W9SES8_9ROSA|nr:hypothetical protein L484_000416 [Morus notabilis]
MEKLCHRGKIPKAQPSSSSSSESDVSPPPPFHIPTPLSSSSLPPSSQFQESPQPEPIAILDPRQEAVSLSRAIVVFDQTLTAPMESLGGSSYLLQQVPFEEEITPSSSSIPTKRKRRLFKDGAPV